MPNNYSSLSDHTYEDRILIHEADPSSDRLSLIEDLDSFFLKIYRYHQWQGFWLIVLKTVLRIGLHISMVILLLYMISGVSYDKLFANEEAVKNINATMNKVTISEISYSFNTTISNFGLISWALLSGGTAVFLYMLFNGIETINNYWEIKRFYNNNLKITDSELGDLTWCEVQKKLLKVQKEEQISIHKDELTELDIYHRILRKENYLVAMVNKRLLPPTLKVPFVGEVKHWTPVFQFVMEHLLFGPYFSPFVRPWQIREEYKKPHMRHELTRLFQKNVNFVFLLTCFFCPVILIWQFFYTIFQVIAYIRSEPGVFTIRRFSPYSKLYFRHFNELEHELDARLARSHKLATKYMQSFYSATADLLKEYLTVYCAAIITPIYLLVLYDDNILIRVEHLISILAISTVCYRLFSKLSPDPWDIYDTGQLMHKLVLHTHYMFHNWAAQAHTEAFRKKFEQLFQYTWFLIIEDVLSPIITCYVLRAKIYPRSVEFVDFFRNFTVNVSGVGDVCGIAQMDLHKHGNPEWHGDGGTIPDQYSQCEDGKVEMSLFHFKTTNPNWKPPENLQKFVETIQNRSLSFVAPVNRLEAIHSLPPLSSVIDDRLNYLRIPEMDAASSSVPQQILMDASQHLSWSNRNLPYPQGMKAGKMFNVEGNSLSSFLEMSITVDYLHSIHNNMAEGRVRNTAEEETPLLNH